LTDGQAREAYLRGRLVGLKELIRVLEDALSKGGGEAIAKSIAEHISSELEEIIGELKETARESELKEIEEKHEEFKATQPSLSKEHVRKAGELMESLMDVGRD